MKRYSLRDLVRGPGLLSLGRLPLAIAFVLTLDRPWWPWGVLAASALTDVLDGWYARRTGQVTKTGALVDGVMDKLFVGVVVIALVASERLGVLAALALATREAGELVIAGYLAAARRARLAGPHRAQPLGKLTTTLQYLTVVSAIAEAPLTGTLAALTAAAGLLAAMAYWREETGAPLANGSS